MLIRGKKNAADVSFGCAGELVISMGGPLNAVTAALLAAIMSLAHVAVTSSTNVPKPAHQTHTVTQSSQQQNGETNSADWTIAKYTLWLTIFTGFLAVSTIALWHTTKTIGDKADETTRILQRAFIAAELAGVELSVTGEREIWISADLRNTGHLPARSIRYTLDRCFDISGDKRFATLKQSGDQSLTLAPGQTARITAAELKRKPDWTEGFLYLVGRITYDDGFGEIRTTNFCHRYNLASIAPDSVHSDRRVIRREHGRSHVGGDNGAD